MSKSVNDMVAELHRRVEDLEAQVRDLKEAKTDTAWEMYLLATAATGAEPEKLGGYVDITVPISPNHHATYAFMPPLKKIEEVSIEGA